VAAFFFVQRSKRASEVLGASSLLGMLDARGYHSLAPEGQEEALQDGLATIETACAISTFS
jgi:hypothetical protein